MAKKKTPRSVDELATLDNFLKQEGKLEEFEAVAIKEVLAREHLAKRHRNES